MKQSRIAWVLLVVASAWTVSGCLVNDDSKSTDVVSSDGTGSQDSDGTPGDANYQDAGLEPDQSRTSDTVLPQDTEPQAEVDEDTAGPGITWITWVDDNQGLMWVHGLELQLMTQLEARDLCKDLVVDGLGNWRLPSIWELRGLVRGCERIEQGGTCQIGEPNCVDTSYWNNTTCSTCDPGAGPDEDTGYYWSEDVPGGQDSIWSGTIVPDKTDMEHAWYIQFHSGTLFWAPVDELDDGSSTTWGVFCVR